MSQLKSNTDNNDHNQLTSQNHMPTRLNKYALLCAILASTNSILLGYDIGVMSGAAVFIKKNLKISSTQEEVLVGTLNVFSLFGSLASGKTSDVLGRRFTIIIAAGTFFTGALLMSLAPSFAFLVAGRLVAGIGVGFSLMIGPVYTAELSPAMTRGFLTSLPEVSITVGILIGYVVNYALSGLPESINWRIMLSLAAIPAVGIAIGVLGMPESPRWLVLKGRIEAARGVLVKTSESEEEAQLRLDEITEAAGLQSGIAGVVSSQMNGDQSGNADNWHGQGAWKELLIRPSRPIVRMLVTAIGINFFMQASGNDAVMYYLPSVFMDAGIKGTKALFGINVIMGISKTIFVLLSAIYLDRFGRRPLLLLGTIGMTLSLTGLGLGSKYLEQSIHKPGWAIGLCIVAVCADVSFFSIGLGPVTWVYSCEIFPSRLRAQGTALAVSVNRLVSGIVAMTFLTISEKLTFGGTFLVLAGVMAIGTLFFYLCLPETKGRSLEEMGAIFADKENRDHVGTGVREIEVTGSR